MTDSTAKTLGYSIVLFVSVGSYIFGYTIIHGYTNECALLRNEIQGDHAAILREIGISPHTSLRTNIKTLHRKIDVHLSQ